MNLRATNLVKSEEKEDEIEEELKSMVDENKSEERRRIDAHFEKLIEPSVLPEIDQMTELNQMI